VKPAAATSHQPAPVLAVRALSVALPGASERAHAVQNVSFDVPAGKIVCLLGESGSGKSVIANTVMGLLPQGLRPVAGTVQLLGEDVLKASSARLRQLRGPGMAMVFQEPMTALNPVMRCGAQIDEMLAAHRTMPRAARREKILSTLQRVRLPEPERMYAAYPHQLSGGQRQRIVIAIALMLKPALLICDEPTTALDVTTQAEILKLIVALQKDSGSAVLFITHDFGVVAEIADEVVVMERGALVERGDKMAVLTAPQHPYTRMLLDAVPELAVHQRPPRPGGEAAERPLLQVSKLGKTYVLGNWPAKRHSVLAAADVSLSLHAGETIGIVGESGSGKSTLARCIARLIAPSSGSILAAGGEFAHATGRALSPLRRVVQVVFQDPYRSLNPRQSVGASIIEGPLNFGVPRAAAWQRAQDLMRLVRMTPEALHRYPSEFSGGQRQRISIARALACEPQVLIADEAVSALDVSVQAQILQLLAEIQQHARIAILFITHDLRVASQICDSVLVMHQGRVVEQGPVADVFFNPQQPYTQALLAAAPARGFAFARSSPKNGQQSP